MGLKKQFSEGREANMTTAEVVKCNQKAENLKVYQSDVTDFFVESSDGKILYRVCFDGGGAGVVSSIVN